MRFPDRRERGSYSIEETNKNLITKRVRPKLSETRGGARGHCQAATPQKLTPRVGRPPRAKERSRKEPQAFPSEQGSLSHQSRERAGSPARRPAQSLLLMVSATRCCCFSFLCRRKGGKGRLALAARTRSGSSDPLGTAPAAGSPPRVSGEVPGAGSRQPPAAVGSDAGPRPSRRHPPSAAAALLLELATGYKKDWRGHWDGGFLRMAYNPQPAPPGLCHSTLAALTQ